RPFACVFPDIKIDSHFSSEMGLSCRREKRAMKQLPTWQETKRIQFQHGGQQLYSSTLRLVMVLVLIVVLAACTSDGSAASPHPQSGSGSYLGVILDSPAVVRIISTGQGKLICRACASDGSDIVSPPYGTFPPFRTS